MTKLDQRWLSTGAGIALAALVLFAMQAAQLRVQMIKDFDRWEQNITLPIRFKGSAIKSYPAEQTQQLALGEGRNPFLAFTGEAGIRFHPLIDMAGAQFAKNVDFFAKRDYFGFRNSSNLYFNRNSHYRYVVITGNSEAVGLTHVEPISRKLERILQSRVSPAFRVLNLAMNSATTSNEINYFVNLAFDLHPEFTISHSFATDMVYGLQAPIEFRYIGMFSAGMQNTWSTMIHVNNYDSHAFAVAFPSQINDTYAMDGMIHNLLRYKAIAEAAGGQFIWGLQKFSSRSVAGTPSDVTWKQVDLEYDILAARRGDLQGLDVIDFNRVDGISTAANDPIHTTDASADRIAQIYADYIIERLRK
jgi:hypothetical protein